MAADVVALRAEWRRFVAGKLDPHTPAMTAVLRALVSQSYPPEVEELAFELFSDGFTDGFPARVFFMDASNSEVFVEEDGMLVYPGTVDPELLDIEQVYDSADEEAFLDRDGADAIEDELWDIAAEAFVDWFTRCWEAAGGDAFPLRASIMSHDDLASTTVLAAR